MPVFEDVLAIDIRTIPGGAAQRPSRREQSLAARIGLRQLLSQTTGRDWIIGAEPNGRPTATAEDGALGPDISLAHSGNWAACALAMTGRIGIDIEVPRPRSNAIEIAQAYFSHEEQRAVAAEGEDAFLAFWTLREAMAKADGGGMAFALGLDGADLATSRNGAVLLHRKGQRWVIAHRGGADFHLAVAWAPPAELSGPEGMLATALGRCFSSHSAT
jgi:phosphopantetheinyl transferase